MKQPSNLQFWILSCVLFLSLIINGVSDTLRSVMYPLIEKELHLNYTQFGVLQGMVQFSYMLWAFAIASCVRYTGYKMGFIYACIISIAGYVCTFFSSNFYTILISQLFATCILGALDDGPCSLAVLVFTKYPATLFSIMSGMYGLGAFIGPSYATLITKISPSSSYKGMCLAMLIPIAIGIIVYIFAPFYINYPTKKEKDEKSSSSSSAPSIWNCLCSPMLWFVSLIMNLLVIGERSILNWGTLYCEDVLHLPEESGALLNSRFYFCFMIARFAGGFITDRVGPFKMLYYILPAGFVLYLVGFYLKVTGLYVLPFVGFFVSLYYPTFIIAATRYWKENSAVFISILLPIQSMIGVLFQVLFGVVNDHLGPQYAMYAAVPSILLAVILLALFHMLTLKKEKKEDTEKLLSEDTTTQVLVN